MSTHTVSSVPGQRARHSAQSIASTYQLVDNEHDGHQREVPALPLLSKYSFQVAFQQLHNEDVVVAFLAEPVDLGDALFTLQVHQDLVLLFQIAVATFLRKFKLDGDLALCCLLNAFEDGAEGPISNFLAQNELAA